MCLIRPLVCICTISTGPFWRHHLCYQKDSLMMASWECWKHVGKNTVHQLCLLLSAWIVGQICWIYIMQGTCNIKTSFPFWTCSVSEACPFCSHLLVKGCQLNVLQWNYIKRHTHFLYECMYVCLQDAVRFLWQILGLVALIWFQIHS